MENISQNPVSRDDAGEFNKLIESLIEVGGILVIQPDVVQLSMGDVSELRRARIMMSPNMLRELGTKINYPSPGMRDMTQASHFDLLWFRLPDHISATLRNMGPVGYVDNPRPAGSVVIAMVKLRTHYGFGSLRIEGLGLPHWLIYAQLYEPTYNLVEIEAPILLITPNPPIEFGRH